ncbi:MAG TPA: CaiB/BaiF CoA-transferase family protein [Acidimicrobiia bacterium]|nr:CaiB/BaiF CoA-transferase family protein [Acidimicrobiia bacterium]
MAGPLEGLRVVELGGIGPVPHAGMMLADLGAEVIQIIRPGTVDDPATRADVLNRGKLSMAVELKAEGAAGLILKLVAGSQALVEGFRPGVAERLGLGPDECRAINPALVYGRMTGWGQEGPLATTAGHDIDYIAVSGALGAIGPPDRPYPPLNLVGDFGGGSMLLLAGVLAALVRAGTSGEGDVVDAAMVDGSALLMAMHHGALAGGWWTGHRGRDLFDGSAPFYTTYETADGKWMAVGALEPHFYARLLAGLGLDPDDLPGQMERDRWPDMRVEMAHRFRARTRAEWEEVFSGTDACVVGVYDMKEAPGHPHNRSRGTFVEREGVVQPAPAPRFVAGTQPPGPVPRPGQHTALLLERLGVDPRDVSRLARDGVVQLEE